MPLSNSIYVIIFCFMQLVIELPSVCSSSFSAVLATGSTSGAITLWDVGPAIIQQKSFTGHSRSIHLGSHSQFSRLLSLRLAAVCPGTKIRNPN
ncbi:hypothetical protein AHF37_11869 [Paragonimus kellicotti]|nr:hypothetical protein AHF37_11869 [Paragonimus kellicotti]